MKTDLAKILDECIKEIRNGETIENCLAKHPDVREKLEPLLDMAVSIPSLPKVTPSDEYRKASKARLMARIARQSSQANPARSSQAATVFNDMALSWQRFWHADTIVRRITIPVTLVLLITLIANLFGAFNFLSPQPAMAASQSTLSILSGNVEVQNPGVVTWKKGTDGMTLFVGTRVKTAPDSHALITFFEGSTITLDPDTDVEIQQVDYGFERPTLIVLKQWLGRTWSRVVKMTDSGSHYKIETPSATAVVRGTLFTTEVNETGFTNVATTQGLVSVIAHGEEIYVPANQQTQVETGAAPTQPVTTPEPKSEIIITIDRPAVGSVTDPTGASTGILPSGLPFNQILGSQSSSSSNASQIITVAEPIKGEYTLTLRYISVGTVDFSIQGKSGDNTVFHYTGSLQAEKEGGFLIHLNLYTDGVVIAGGEVTSAEPLGDKTPEKIVKPKLGSADNVNTNTGSTDPGNTSGKDKDKTNSGLTSTDNTSGKDKDKTTSGLTSTDNTSGKDKDKTTSGLTSTDNTSGKDKDKTTSGLTNTDNTSGKDKDKTTSGGANTGNTSGKDKDKTDSGITNTGNTSAKDKDKTDSGITNTGNTSGSGTNNGGKADGGKDTGNKDAGSKDAGSKNTVSTDAGSKDAGSKDTGGKDTGSKDAGSKDTGSKDAGSKDTGSKDAGSKDTGSKDAGSKDTGSKDAGSKDAGSKDTGGKDTGSGGTNNGGTKGGGDLKDSKKKWI